MPKARVLSNEVAAALALSATIAPDTIETPAQQGAEANAETVQATASNTDTTPETPVVAQAAAATPEQPSPALDLVAHLKSETTDLRNQINTLTGEKAQLQSDLNAANTKVTSLEADANGYVNIVRSAAQRLCIALDVPHNLISSLNGVALCDLYKKLDSDFCAKFKAGAQASTETTPPENQNGKVSPVHQAATKAATFKR